jgi:hypothetical protein
MLLDNDQILRGIELLRRGSILLPRSALLAGVLYVSLETSLSKKAEGTSLL